MIDLAYTPAEVKEEVAEQQSPDTPKYPYGLCIYMDEDVLTKIGKSASDFKVGDKMSFPVTFEVTGTSSNKKADGTTSDCINMQITAFDMPGAKSAQDMADNIYSKTKGA